MSHLPLLAGVARTDVTPSVGVRLFGYPVRDRTATAINDPLQATALVLQQGECRAALLALDWIMIEEDDLATLRQAITSATGIPGENLTVSVIQTHCAPATCGAFGWGEKDRAYIAAMMPRLVQVIAEAAASLQPVQVGVATVSSQVGVNRRAIGEDGSVGLGVNPWGLFDDTMTVLHLRGAEKTLLGLVHYGAHPTALGPMEIVSRDWPGYMVDRLEGMLGTPFIFLNGAVGDVAPRTNTLWATGDGLIAAQEVELRAAQDALRGWRSIKEWRHLELATVSEELPLPLAPLPSLAIAEQEFARVQDGREQWGMPHCEFRHWEAVLHELRHGRVDSARLWRQTVTALGPVALVPFAGEPFTEILLRLRHGSPYPYTLGLSTTNGCHGYYVTREARGRGGYEVDVARAFGAYVFAADIDDYLVRENLRLLRQMHGEESI